MAVRLPPTLLAKVNPSLSGRTVAKNMSFVAGGSILGDLGCQVLESCSADTPFTWDHLRTMRMGATGAFVIAPMSLAWNFYAERLAPGSSWRAVLIKTGVSVAVITPMLAAQFTSLTLLEDGKTMDDVQRKLSNDLVPTAMVSLCYWPIISSLNSAYTPVVNRPIVSSFAGIFWNIYISYQANHNGMEVGEVSEVFRGGGQELVRRKSAQVAKHEIAARAMIKSSGQADAADDDDEEDPTPCEKERKFVRRTSVVSL